MVALEQPRGRFPAADIACVVGSLTLCVAALIASSSASYVVDATGRVEDAGTAGLDYDDALFLASFRRPIAEAETLNRTDRVGALRARLRADFEADRSELGLRMPRASDRELLLAYLTLRVNGSTPNFDPTSAIRDDLPAALLADTGNCATLAMRLVLVLQLFDIDAKLVHWWSPAMEGHVFVDAFDPSEGRAYFLDPTLNIVIGVESDGRGFLDTLDPDSPEARRRVIENGLISFPQCFSLAENAAIDLDEWSQANRLRAVDSAVSGLTYGLPIASRKRASGELPPIAGLRELAETYPNLTKAMIETAAASADRVGDP